jgi:hypothetical protein
VRALLLVLLAAAPASAKLEVEARVNRETVAINEQLVLTVVVSGDRSNLPPPQLPSLPRFNVHNAGRSTNFSFVSGRISSTVQYTFVLVPRLIGNAVIGPVTVAAGRERAQSQPLKVKIVRPEAKPSATTAPQRRPAAPKRRSQPAARGRSEPKGPDMYVTAELDKKRPFVNEQTILTVRFHTAVRLLGNAEWTEPETNGMLTEDLPPGPHSEKTHEGRRYMVSEIRLALFPIQPGKLEVGQSTIKTRVARNRAVDPFAADFFQQFFSQGLGSEVRALKTRAIPLTARRLPEKGKPPNFSGAVGSFRISSEVDRTEAKVGDAVNLTVRVEGRGNLKAIGDLELPELDAFRAYEMVGSLNQAKDKNGVTGSKVFKTVLTPKVSGKLTIPAIPFSFFDPQRAGYRIVKTKPLEIVVAPGAAAAAPAPVSFSGAPAGGGQITTVTEDIRHIHEALRSSSGSRWAILVASAGSLTVLPAFLFFGSVGWTFYRERQLQDPAGMRRRGAAGKARSLVRTARSSKDVSEAAAKLSEALSGYLGDKLDRPPSGLTLKDAQQALKKRNPGAPEGHLDQLRRVWQELERIRFAPAQSGDATAQALADGVRDLVDALEEDFKA